MRHFVFTILLGFLSVFGVYAQVNIIPQPVSLAIGTGSFHVTQQTEFILNTQNSEVLNTIKQFINQFDAASGIKLRYQVKKAVYNKKDAILITVNPDTTIKNKEGYILNIAAGRVEIRATQPAGIFYGIETFKQLFNEAFYRSAKLNTGKKWSVPALSINDYPRYGYRGMELDVSRHFYPAAYIKKYLDLLATYKINVFHWHLTDSHGWRLEIKQYPKLTTIGAWRADRKGIPMTIAAVTGKNEPATYGGFYTQDEVKDIIKYAADRFIAIIPEIEIPGHCTAALAAYPEYNDLDNAAPLLRPCGYPGDLKHNFCVSYDSTYVFIQNILKEVMQLFPSPYIHIGGDEVRGEPWLNCSRCRQLMKEKGFTTARQLQAYFTKRIDGFITANGKRTIGWEEILHADVSHQSVGMVWHDYQGALKAVKKNYDVVMTPYRYTYFDFYQSDPRLEKFITYAPLFLDSVYAFNPLPQGLTATEARHIKGGQACLWTENIETTDRVEYMTFPRLMALAEALWTPVFRKNYDGFISRTEGQFKTLDARGVSYAKSMYNVGIHPVFDSVSTAVKVSLTGQTGNRYQIRYATDGTEPSVIAPAYQQLLTFSKNTIIKAFVTNQNQVLGMVNADTININKATGAPVAIWPLSKDTAAVSGYHRLTDGIMGTVEPYDGRWVSLSDTTVRITIDLKNSGAVHSIGLRVMEDQVSNIYQPQKVTFSVSEDGKIFKTVYAQAAGKVPEGLLRHLVYYNKTNVEETARFVQVTLQNANINPVKGDNLFFLDELIIN